MNVNAAVSASGLNEKKHWAARTDPARGRPANQCSRFACILLKLPRFCAKTVRQTRHLATRVRTSRITDFRIGNYVIVARASVDFETPSATRQSLSNFYRLWCGGHSGRKSVGTPTDRLPFIAFGSLIVIMRALGNGAVCRSSGMQNLVGPTAPSPRRCNSAIGLSADQDPCQMSRHSEFRKQESGGRPAIQAARRVLGLRRAVGATPSCLRLIADPDRPAKPAVPIPSGLAPRPVACRRWRILRHRCGIAGSRID